MGKIYGFTATHAAFSSAILNRMETILMSYNLYEGAHASYTKLVDFIRRTNVNILCLQEVNGWQDNNFAILEDFAAKCGLPYYVFGNSNSEFKLATFSRAPIISSTVYTEGFRHCVVQTTVEYYGKDLDVFNVHLNPKLEGPRVEEIKKILAIIDSGRPTIITGDFNSITRQDNYSPSLFSELQARGITKFGREDLEFSVTDLLREAGYFDMASILRKQDTTVPSAFNRDKNHQVPLRLDYIFASRHAADRITAIDVIKDEITDTISDHYPIRAILS